MNKVVERVNLEDPDILPQTKTHHIARYVFATTMGPGTTALDLGSGTGYGVKILEDHGYKTSGVEIDTEAVAISNNRYPDLNFIQQDLRKYGTRDKYDLVTLFEVIEHLSYEDGVNLIKKVSGYAKTFMISTPRDINDKYNIYHRSEWSYGTLKNVLGSVFENVRIYGQDWSTGIISEDNVRDNDFYIAVCTHET